MHIDVADDIEWKLVHDHIEVAFEKFVGYLTKKNKDANRIIPIDNAMDSSHGR